MFKLAFSDVFKKLNSKGNFHNIPADLLSKKTGAEILNIMERSVKPNLRPLETRIHGKLTARQKLNYGEKIHKVMRVKTFRIDSPKHEALWKSFGLEQWVSPEVARRVCEKLFGCRFRKEVGKQIVSYFEGDYFGPHNDHHPEFPHMKNGYVDFHYYVNSPDVLHQLLVHEEKGHLNKFYSLTGPVGLNVYKLPFWHYTTPLQLKPGASKKAGRWILMYTFYFDTKGPEKNEGWHNKNPHKKKAPNREPFFEKFK